MTDRPRSVQRPGATRLDGLGTSIFTEMTALAVEHGAINLGQGFPDTDGPDRVLEAAVAALTGGHNQYAPLPGVPALREAIAAHQRRHYGLEPEEILVTFGATEAIAAAMLGLCEPGDEVILLEPYYDSYAAVIQFAGAVRRPVTLRPPDFALDLDELRAAVTPRTRLVLLNTPHNPTGRVLTRDELQAVAELCIEYDLICVSDEVYEHLVYDGAHIPIATLPGMGERTVTISSVGKSYSVTGWKTGWASGPAPLIGAVRTVKQFLTFAGGTPLQHAAAVALNECEPWVDGLRAQLRENRDLLAGGLQAAGYAALACSGTYFINADVGQDAVEFCRRLPLERGIVAIPTGVFYDDKQAGATLVRFAFCKRPEVISAVVQRLSSNPNAGGARHLS
jgi:N-succinyldiaminopimelate aminotransferase